MLHYRGLLQDFGEENITTTILTDSSSSIQTIINPVSSKYKFKSIIIHYLKQLVKQENVQLVFIQRQQNIADVRTKQNSTKEF